MRIPKRAAVVVPAVVLGTLALGVAPASAAPSSNSSCVASTVSYFNSHYFPGLGGQFLADVYSQNRDTRYLAEYCF